MAYGGHMAAGVLGEDLVVRVGPDGYGRTATRPGARRAPRLR